MNINSIAYCKLMMHAAKYPLETVCGVLIATNHTNSIIDVIPISHNPLIQSPMLSVALDQIEIHLTSGEGCNKMAGIYFANRVTKNHDVPHQVLDIANHMDAKISEDVFILRVNGLLLIQMEAEMLTDKQASGLHVIFIVLTIGIFS